MIPSSKWSLHRFFAKHPVIKGYMPPTALYRPTLLGTYLHRYHTVFIKPSREHMGRGIIKVWKTHRGYSFVKQRGQTVSVPTLSRLRQKLQQKIGEKQHIIQKGIPLSKVKGRPFDIRVMMMRNGSGKWQYAGMLAKVAAKNSVVTNVAGGGKVITVQRAIAQSRSVKPERRAKLMRELIKMSYLICDHFNKYKHSSLIGIDWAIDKTGKLVLIEVNFDFPGYGPFADLPTKIYYHRIKRLRSEYLAWRKQRKRKKPALSS
ncbi:YheC/YheD family protein [Brevibacillus ruminantium]|uniref:YheC/YheD family protein n=1 Tax=Brevibacillus ruminantium TaxID=2950604 RepID=A0ABY4WBB2_9BACL|nr:YheC/YheD family protein [Brevibacillus ruminantium]USG64327.1 YheC/YheD family protein [Brevibacillus ruminantium]